MRGRILSACFVFGLLAFVAPACSSTTTTTPTTPTTSVTSTFSGTLTLNGSFTFNFDVASGGTIQSTLTVGPDSTTPIAMSIGIVTGQSCAEKVSNDVSFQGTVVTGQLSGATTMCVRVNDAKGTVTGPLAFQVDVIHP